MKHSVKRLITCGLTLALSASLTASLSYAGAGSVGKDGKRTSYISDDAVVKLDLEGMPKRPKPWLELGSNFLGSGLIPRGIELDTGAVWQPQLLVFGTYRTALQAYNAGGTSGNAGETQGEWANRMDIFANLALSGSERILVGIRPLDDNGRFTGYNFTPDPTDGWEDEYNGDITTAFFEGDFGEIFPNLDPEDFGSLDLGFSIGRQPLNYQAGLLINDNIDSIGITRNTLLPKGGTDLQISAIYGWNQIHRGDTIEDDSLHLTGLLVAADYPRHTWNAEVFWLEDTNVDQDEDGFFYGFSTVRRIGHYNSTFRIVGSHNFSESVDSTKLGTGTVVMHELSTTPPWTEDIVYLNAFLAVDEFTSVARAPGTGGPLGAVGILFAGAGMGRYGSGINNQAQQTYGGAMGYQHLFGKLFSKQFTVELGYRHSTNGDVIDPDALGIGARYQQAWRQHIVFNVDGFATRLRDSSTAWGTRFETRYEF